MTPKEKALKLYNQMAEFTNEEYPHTSAMQCAFIVVDEIIVNLHWLEDSINFDKAIKFWQEVKLEIEKL